MILDPVDPSKRPDVQALARKTSPAGQSLAGRGELACDRRRIDPVLRKLGAIAVLNAAETQVVERLTEATEHHRAGAELSAEGAIRSPLAIFSGWACRQRLFPDGRRQIVDFLLPGDIVGFNIKPGPLETCSIMALTVLQTANATSLLGAALDGIAHPGLAAALAAGPGLEQARLLEQVVRLGRLSAHERTPHLFLELHRRLSEVGFADQHQFPLPVTQEVLADALSLSIVHINRVLLQLRRERLIEMTGGRVQILNLPALAAISQGGAFRSMTGSDGIG